MDIHLKKKIVHWVSATGYLPLHESNPRIRKKSLLERSLGEVLVKWM